MTKLSVNVNKVATLRNSRGGTEPSVLEAVRACVRAGAPGITVHPRADQRHITPKLWQTAKSDARGSLRIASKSANSGASQAGFSTMPCEPSRPSLARGSRWPGPPVPM